MVSFNSSLFTWIFGVCIAVVFLLPSGVTHAQSIATTTLLISVCGDLVVSEAEECDLGIASTSNLYSTTILGRNCNNICLWAPYCGDGVLQTTFGEECDDGNNVDGDYCAADCTEEEADSGGGSTGGGGSSSAGGRDTDLGDTQVIADGKAYPNSTVNILIDGDTAGTVRANSLGKFRFTTDVANICWRDLESANISK
ncbi:DUF4215 domain-containing protein [bacterium]|nr:DUF4215 domain-containing protein [bacterium]